MTISNDNQIIQCIVTNATGMYLQLSNVGSEIEVCNFGYLSSGNHCYVNRDVKVQLGWPHVTL